MYIERVERRVCEEDDNLSKPDMNLENWTYNLEKSECAGRAFSERETKSNNFFLK